MLQIAGCEARICQHCLEEFTTRPWGRGSGAVFCSRACVNLAAARRRRAWGTAKTGHEWDALLPEQMGENAGREPGEYALLRAMLERAVMDVRGDARTNRQVEARKEAREWFASESEEPWSFRWVAYHLGVEPDWFRLQLARSRGRKRIRRDHARGHAITRGSGGGFSGPQDVVPIACNG